MKYSFLSILGLFLCTACQNELYINPQEVMGSAQGAYVDARGPVQVFVEEGKDYVLRDVKVGLSVKEGLAHSVKVSAGDQAQLEAYNRQNGTSYILLPQEMYEVPASLDFEKDQAMQILPVQLKNLKFAMEGEYALPLCIQGGTTEVVPGEDHALVILEKLTRTKVLRMAGSEAGSDKMFPADFKVNQWTLEVMIKRAAYRQNNKAIAGTKLVSNAGPMDEIYTRFGDVTIEPNQLQIKTGASQIDVDKARFAAEPEKWYMIAFVYDGKNTLVYVNGELVAQQQIREGAYGLVGFWLSGANEFVREVRFWDVARNAKQIKEFVWKMVDPTQEGLLLYYPCNGLRRSHETGEIMADESKIWNWATYYSGDKSLLDLPLKGSVFDTNNGDLYTFPLQD